MMIQPVIFCTIVIGVGSVRSAASVGKVGGLALAYFLTMSTVALAIGLVVGNLIDPGEGLNLTDDAGEGEKQAAGAGSTTEFIVHIVPDSLFSSLTSGEVLQTLLVALLVGFALQSMGREGRARPWWRSATCSASSSASSRWSCGPPRSAPSARSPPSSARPAGRRCKSLAVLMVAFYITCFIFVFGVLGTVLKVATGVNIFSLFKYLAREFLLILSTSSSESALPRVIAKMEHAGVDRTTVGVVIPTGYSFNLDGTAIYLTMASIFIADALGKPLSIGEQISLLVFMIIASKGAAGVSGAGLATLAGGLVLAPPGAARRRRPDRRHRPVHVRGPGADELRGQLGGHGADRPLDGDLQPRAARPRPGRRRPVRRADDARRGPLRGRAQLRRSPASTRVDPDDRAQAVAAQAVSSQRSRLNRAMAARCRGQVSAARASGSWSRCSNGSVESPVKIISCSAWARRTTSSGIQHSSARSPAT